ncbi:MAG: hypothetical protein K9W43_04255 [Candidatus Thorarchaeota archaeon]|nr:hypothetical protein [Candidatus Thorarchaeota archaeon]
MADIFNEYLSKVTNYRIVSDGDLDGIFATGFLLQYFEQIGQSVQYEYPAPKLIRGMEVSNSILIELPLTKGLVYRGTNLLIDHHNEAPHLQLYSGATLVSSCSLDFDVRAVTEVITFLIKDRVTLPKEAESVLSAVSRIDQGIYESDLDFDLHHAYLLEIESSQMRARVTEWVRRNQWSKIIDWANDARHKWQTVQQHVSEFVRAALPVIDNAVYFTYGEGSIERSAMRDAMLQLETEHPIVVAVQMGEDGSVSRISIGTTREDIDLTPMFDYLRSIPGVTAGGRKSIGGAQFPENLPLSTVIEYLSEALNQLVMEDS